MDLSARVLGSTVANQLRARTAAVVLTIGRDTFDRAALASVTCFNFIAAANLSRILADLEVKDTRTLFETVPPTALALPRLGAVSLAVLGAAFEAKGLGGETPLVNWYRKHTKGGEDAMVAFASLKHRELAEQRAAAKALRGRRNARRHQAHSLRVSRFTARQEAENG
jgi:hypothetical protein